MLRLALDKAVRSWDPDLILSFFGTSFGLFP